MKNLYLLTTRGLGSYYVIAADPTEAQTALKKIFDEQNYGYSDGRDILKIELLTSGLKPGLGVHKHRPFLSDDRQRLLIVEDWFGKEATHE